MSWLAVWILSVVEGLTEFLPVSSTGHMILAGQLWQLPQGEFMKSFEIIIQLGAILAVLSAYWRTLLKQKDYWTRIIAGFIPTMVIGLLFYKVVKYYFLGNVGLTLWGLGIGGILILVIEKWLKAQPIQNRTISSLTLIQAAVIGVFQGMAIIPGVSRSAATILPGLVMGMSRQAAVEFSFLLALPVMSAAAALDVYKSGFHFTSNEWFQLGMGLVIAFVVARLTVSFLIKFVAKHDLRIFGWYRVVLVAVYLLFTR